jgi:PAS domain S-box-containing protein
VAERRHVEARLRESEARFRSIVESSPMGVHLYRLDPDGRLVLTGANPASSRILGFDASGLVGLSLEEAFPSLSQGGVPDRYRRICREGGALSSDDLPVSDPRLEGRVQLHAFQTAPGMMAVMFLDVTAKRRAEAERRALEEQLRHSQKMEAVGRLAGGIAHDFNNLLMVIMGHGELLRRSLGPEDPRQRKLEQVLGASDRASRLVRQLLAFSSRQVMEPQVVDLGEVVRETARMLRPLLGEDVRVTTRVEASLWRARVDPAQVEQVLVNLAVNARDAMPAGGALSLEAANVEVDGAGPVAPGGYVALYVRDTGHGMDEATRAKVFEPFFTTKTRSGGTGLGLAMVYGIVQQSGGHIDLETARGEGTTFRILFPRHDGELRPAAPRPLPARRGASGETVLGAEDEPAIRNLACEMLQAQGYTAIGARSGEEALALAGRAEAGIDLLLTDVVMPGMSGRELVERFRELRPRARVLFMSGYAGDDLTSRGVAEEGAHFIPKPFTPELLAERVREALDRAD